MSGILSTQNESRSGFAARVLLLISIPRPRVELKVHAMGGYWDAFLEDLQPLCSPAQNRTGKGLSGLLGNPLFHKSSFDAEHVFWCWSL